MLNIYNTMSRRKERFEPLVAGEVRMYVCGMTVYDFAHVGHARLLVAFDTIQRWLRASGLRVTYVRNVTDIDDKIIRRAVENGETISALTQRFIDATHEDETALGILRSDHEPRATQYVPQMLQLVSRLQQRGLAYRTADGDMCFKVRRFAGYGRLSGKSLDDLRAGERVDVGAGKDDPLDFVLWKSAKDAEPDEVKWPSDFGVGRPGWHLECSAMSCTLLGDRFDIHGGGMDLQFPHHENEIAQSDGSLGFGAEDSFVRYWMHNGFVQVDNAKMSKSLGNFFTVREVRKLFDGEVLRYFLMRSHYRSPVNFSDSMLEDARQELLRLYGAVSLDLGDTSAAKVVKLDEPDTVRQLGQSIDWSHPVAARLAEAMNDDFNTPVAVSLLKELANAVHRDRQPQDQRLLRSLSAVLGLLGKSAEEVRRGALLGSDAGQTGQGPTGAAVPDDVRIEELIAQRVAAKKARDFAGADKIRAELAAMGIELQDAPSGTTWRRR